MKAFIVSYFGSRSNPDLRERRKDYHAQQLDWLYSEGFKKSEIKICAQDYDEDDFVEGIEYLISKPEALEKKLPVSNNRNYLLDTFFWDSDDDWCLILDNDAILDERKKGNVISHLREGNDLKGVDCFCPINPNVPGRGSFNRIWEDHRIDDNWVFERGEFKGSLMVLKNLNKYYGFRLSFDEGERCDCSEDYFFAFDLARLGCVPMWCNNILLLELARSAQDGMTWVSDDRSRHEYENVWKKQAQEEFGIVYDGKSLKKSEFYSRYQIPKEVVIPKEENSALMDFF